MVHSSAARSVVRRFVAGETMEEAFQVAARLQQEGFSVSLDHLGENVSSEQEADAAHAIYVQLLDQIQARQLDANVSVKLTQMGLDFAEARCGGRLGELLDRAAYYGNFVRVDMEGSAYTDRTLSMVGCLYKRFSNVGTVIQSYLYRSQRDVEQLLSAGIRIRLCKGAYQEPPDIAFPRKQDVDANYVELMKLLLKSGIYHGIATHDQRMIRATIDFAAAEKIGKDSFEFQMLYGIRRDLQTRLRADGYRVRIYVPYGSHWFPYFTRRLAERPANVMFFVRNFFRR